jgi:hypothetical protein
MTTEPELAVGAVGAVAGPGAGVIRSRTTILASSGNPGSSGSSGGSGGSRLSSSGGAAGSGGGSGSGSGRPPGAGGSGGSGGVPPSSGRPGSGRPGGPSGPERSVSYQPEERYWTDYLRIAFPVLGLLLLLGLFWFWATELIDNNDEPNGTTVAQQTLTAGPSPTNGSGEGTEPQLTAETEANGEASATSDNEPRATRTPRSGNDEPTATEAKSVGQFEEDDVVVTNGDANLRSEPEDGDNVVQVLPEGTELTVTGPSVEDGDRIWVPVVDNETGDLEGYVAEELLDAA